MIKFTQWGIMATLVGAVMGLHPAMAVPPASITRDSDVRWSEVVDDPFDGLIVYDRNFASNRAYVSSWSAQEIRMTYYWSEQHVVGTRTVWRDRRVYRDGEWVDVPYPEEEPIYRTETYQKTPKAILFALDEQVYRYEEGPISPDLARALVNAPSSNITIRLLWPDGSTDDVEIGRGTVEAWRTVFADRASGLSGVSGDGGDDS
ncbi:hypothetical protein PN462_13615 [Spirulina sp. CS-785/01]|uniref:hypothetical protein n=1 Tax=Spirulina sp. CS-785/01 TaxID=3021716 RepID=UPI0023301B54|nr:hypothetical protein [Spirulina sp. CS-785/01]MDB9314144.1 hypothetical protein [Spirulina sp. CS-785/01]